MTAEEKQKVNQLKLPCCIDISLADSFGGEGGEDEPYFKTTSLASEF